MSHVKHETHRSNNTTTAKRSNTKTTMKMASSFLQTTCVVLIAAITMTCCHLSCDDANLTTFMVDAFSNSISTSSFLRKETTSTSASTSTSTSITIVNHYNPFLLSAPFSQRTGIYSNVKTSIKNTNSDRDEDDDVSQLRNEIDEMRKEALDKLNELDIRASSTTTSSPSSVRVSANDGTSVSAIVDTSSTIVNTSTTTTEATATATATASPINDGDDDNDNVVDKNIENDIKSRKIMEQISIDEEVSSSPIYSSSSKPRDVLSLLDNTTWKVSLNIGREPGMYSIIYVQYHTIILHSSQK